MAGLPVNVSTCTVTGRLAATMQVAESDPEPDVVPLVGKVIFTPSVPTVIHEASNTIFVPNKIEVTLDDSGNFSVILVASDDPDLNPTNWTYTVSFALASGSIAPFSFFALGGQTIEITDITPVMSSAGSPIVRGETGPPGPPNVLTVGDVTTGPPGSDAEFTIEGTSPHQTISVVIPRGDPGGGGAVDSVNGETGVVVLDAADVGAATAAQGAKADSASQPGHTHTASQVSDFTTAADARIQNTAGIGTPPTIANISLPQIAAHRLGLWGAGESTIRSAEIAVGAGLKVLETDFCVTADGVPVLSHDLTLDRTTTGTGLIKETSYQQIANTIQVDPAVAFQATGYANQPVPTVDELLDKFLGRAVILLENKLEITIHPTVRANLSARWAAKGAQNSVIIQTFGYDDALQWIALGWKVMLLEGAPTQSPTALKAAGFYGVIYNFSNPPTAPQTAGIAAAKAAGLKVGTYTHRFKYESDAAIAAGSDFPISDHPIHALSAQKQGRVADFSSNVYPPGTLGLAATSVSLANGRLSIAADGPTEPHAMIGSCGPITETSFTVSATGRFVGATAPWLSIFIQGPTDALYKTQNGYHALLRSSGTLDVYRWTAPSTAVNIGTLAGTALAADTDYTVTLRITPTQVIATRTDTGGTVTVTDSTYRHSTWWPHVGRNGGNVQYSRVSVAT